MRPDLTLFRKLRDYLNSLYGITIFNISNIYKRKESSIYFNINYLDTDQEKHKLFKFNIQSDEFVEIEYKSHYMFVIETELPEYLCQWNNTFINFATNTFMPTGKWEYQVFDEYFIYNVIPLFNTDETYIIHVKEKDTGNNYFILFKDENMFEIKLYKQYESVTLDLLTYKLSGIYCRGIRRKC